MLPVIVHLRETPDVELRLVLMTSEEAGMAAAAGVPFEMLDVYATKARRLDFDLAWGVEPLINAIRTFRPDIFLCIEVNYILRNAVRYCRQAGIRSIVVQHGTPNRFSLHAFLPFEGDRFLAWNAFSKDFLCRHGMPDRKVVVTGAIPFDRTQTIVPDRVRIAAEAGLDGSRKWAVFTTQGVGAGNMPSLDEIRTGLVETAREFANHPDWQIVYQVHPSQKIEDVRAILDEAGFADTSAVRYHDTEELIKAGDAMITFFSTTAIDAVLLRKPLLLINLSDDRDFFPFAEMGVALAAFSRDDIAVSIRRLIGGFQIDDDKYAAAVHLMNHVNDGQALPRVLKNILE